MRKEVSRKISLLLVMLMVMMMVAGCGDKKTDSSKETTTKEVAATGENNGESNGGTEEGNTKAQDSDFDFNQVFDNIEVNGKHVPFPFTLNDLGEGFEVKYVTEMEEGICCGTLYYGEEEVAGIYMNINSKDEFDENTDIFRIDISRYDTQMIKVKGIDCTNSVENIKKSFVGLDEKFDDNKVLISIEKRQKNNLVYFFFDEEEVLCSIRIIKGE